MAIKQIKPGLYMVTGNGGNSTVRVTDQGVILVDTKNLGDQFYNELVALIKTVSPQPVKYALRVVALGDEFTAAGPNCDYPMGGSILDWSKLRANKLGIIRRSK